MRGVPFVGRELALASRTTAAGLLGAGRRDRGRTVAAAERCRAADLTSYSPPADAAFSSSRLLWRPRPFTDRRPGHVYLLACPLYMRLARGGLEPLHCTMALYSLPGASGGAVEGRRGLPLSRGGLGRDRGRDGPGRGGGRAAAAVVAQEEAARRHAVRPPQGIGRGPTHRNRGVPSGPAGRGRGRAARCASQPAGEGHRGQDLAGRPPGPTRTRRIPAR